MVKKIKNIKRKKHQEFNLGSPKQLQEIFFEIINDYDKIKSRHLEKLASKMLKDEERRDNLRLKNIKGDFLNKF